jgi:hypothetical protein
MSTWRYDVIAGGTSGAGGLGIQNRLDAFSWHLGSCNTTSESDEMHTISAAGINETLLLPRGRNRQEMFRKVKKVK